MIKPDAKAIRAQMEALEGFTPGPWNADLGETYRVKADGMNIATANFVTLLDRIPTDQVRQNARLIAAAPDMRTTILALCDALDAANAEARLLRSAVTHAHADVHDLLGVATDDEADAILAAWSRIGRALPDTDAQVIDKLRTEVERLRTALAPFLKAAELFPEPPGTVKFDISIYCPAAGPEFELRGDDLRRARAALAQKGGE